MPGAAVDAPRESAGSPLAEAADAIAPSGAGIVASVNAMPQLVIDATPDAGGNGGGARGSAPRPRREPRERFQVPAGEDDAAGQKASCTLAQMRRFIKSRPYVPVHELRRRFMIAGIEDEVSPMATGQGTLYVGLPEREAGFLGELVKAGEVGCELLLDPTSPGIVGVFPMRPVARQ